MSRGSYYGLDRTTFGVTSGRIELATRFSLEPSASINWFHDTLGSPTTRVLRSRVTYTFTPRMFVSALLQYNSATDVFGTNLRWRWEYSPGSELFVVYTDDHNTELPTGRLSTLQDRGLVVKLNRLVRF